MITQKTVQEILTVVRIEDIVGDFVTLKRKGANMGGLCPFHNEKTPSFNVNPVRNIFKCFGCGEGGDSVSFLMKHENISYPEALRYIAKKYNVAVEETEVSKEVIQEKQAADALFIVNERALKFYQNQLFETDKGKSIGLQYFKQRGFREETIRKWGLGFAPEYRDALTKTLVTEGYSIENLRKVGLTSSYDNDFFRGRVMFSIQGLSGKPIAFAGRIMQTDAKAPKYINSPETEIYLKSKILYGLYHARKMIQKNDECILCEGYTDVISLHQAGIENVVASSGTSLTTEQIRLIKRFTPNIKIIYDGDAAGIKAAIRGLDLVLEEDMNVKIVLLPNKEDPDSYVQSVGATAFLEYIDKEAKDFIFFKINQFASELQGNPSLKNKLATEIAQSLSYFDSLNTKLDTYISKAIAILQIDEGAFKSEIIEIRNKRNEKQVKEDKEKLKEKRNREYEEKRKSDPILHKLTLFFKTDSPSEKQKILKEIVFEISKIDDDVLKLFSIRQVAKEIKINESELVELVNKNISDFKKGKNNIGESAPSIENVIDTIGAPAESNRYENPNIKAVDKGAERDFNRDEFQEKDIARILVVHGGDIFDEENNLTVAAFVMSNIEDVIQDFDNKLYQRIAQETATLLQNNTPLSIQYFLSHKHREIQDFATTMLSSPYEYSENWEAKFNRPLETQKAPDLNFIRDAEQSLKRFKLRKVFKMMSHNEVLLRKAEAEKDDSMYMRHLKIQMKLNDMKGKLGAELGTVVFK